MADRVQVYSGAPLSNLGPGEPQRLGPYRLLGRLGQGGMGTVYLGVDRDGTGAAVKMLRPELADDEASRARFRRELELAERVRASCTAQVLGGDVDGSPVWIATEYVAGPTLAAHVAEHGPLGPDALLAFAVGMAEALTAIHAAGVVHRDLTARNVLLSADGPRVVDFGIARAASSTTLTATGGVMGTPGWLAPEVIRGGEATEAADVFAWGSLVVLAATGEGPFGEGRPEQVMYRLLHSEPKIPDLPQPLGQLVTDALSSDPQDRPTPKQLVAALTATTLITPPTDQAEVVTELIERTWHLPVETEAVAAPADREGGGRRRLAVLAVAAVLLLTGAGLVVLANQGNNEVALVPEAPASPAPGETEAPGTPTGTPDPTQGPNEDDDASPGPTEGPDTGADDAQSTPDPDPTDATPTPSPDPTAPDDEGTDEPEPEPTTPVATEPVEETPTPPDPTTVDLSPQLPPGQPEVVRTVADRDDGPPGILVVAGDADTIAEPGTDLILSGLLFEWDGAAYAEADRIDLYCIGGFEPVVVDGAGEIVYIDCIGGASANSLWALHPHPSEIVEHPFDIGEVDYAGWNHSGWTTEPQPDGPDILMVDSQTCIPNCAEGYLENRWLVYEPERGEWGVDSCRPQGERLYYDPRPSASQDPHFTGPC